MAWLWDSFEHYAGYVEPVVRRELHQYNSLVNGTLAARVSRLALAVRELDTCREQLIELGFDDVKSSIRAKPDVSEAFPICSELVDAGESVLTLHYPLATSDYAAGFLYQHDMLSHWSRYAASNRIIHEIIRLVEDSHGLIEGYHWFAERDNRFLFEDLNLPDELGRPFLTARDLFSVGEDELALFSAARGLELVLRRIARLRKVRIRIRSTPVTAADLSTHDLIEVFYRIRWRQGGDRVISPSMRALLHYLRQVRNAGAHGGTGDESLLKARETALLVATAASQLWHKLARSKIRFRSSTIEKTWAHAEGVG